MEKRPDLSEDIKRGREKYGMGRLHIRGALDFAENLDRL
jgi:hypothetical protein